MAPATLKYKLKKVEDGVAGDEKPVCAFFSLPQGCRNGAKCPFVHGEAGAAAASEERPRATPTSLTTGATKNAQAMQQVRLQLALEQSKKRTAPAPSTPVSGAASTSAKRFKRQEPEVEESTEEEDEEEEEEEAPTPPPRIKPAAPVRHVPVTTTAAPAIKKVAAVAPTVSKPVATSSTIDDAMNPFLAVARPPTSAAPKQQQPAAPQQQQQQKKQVPAAPARNTTANNYNKTKVSPAAKVVVPVPAAAVVAPAQRKQPAARVVAAAPSNNKSANGNGGGMLGKIGALPVTPFTITRHKVEVKQQEEEKMEEGEVEEEEGEVVEEELYVKEDEVEEEEEEQQQQVIVKKVKKQQQPTRQQQQQQQRQQQQQQQALKEEAVVEEEVCVHRGSNWSCCVKATLEHARFEPNYRVMASKTKGEGEWIEARKHGAWCKDLPHVLALDCEMCATRDPVSMEQDGKALIRLSVVSGHDENQVLLDTLVLPSLPVIDYRTDIHGIRPEDLRSVMFTFRHAQAAMLHLCCTETVLVGHGLCNDLTALKMKHSKVVDTALLFEREDAPNHTPALKDVAGALLGLDMPDMHDSVADAQVTLRIARHFLEQGPVAPVPRLPAASNKKGRRVEAQQSCLLLHRIPLYVKAEHIVEMFQSRTHVMPVAVDPVVATGGEGSLGRATARFLSKHHADLAFSTLTGPARPDKDGRPQKRVHLAGKKDYVQVRLMYAPGMEGEEEGEGAGEEEAVSSPPVKIF